MARLHGAYHRALPLAADFSDPRSLRHGHRGECREGHRRYRRMDICARCHLARPQLEARGDRSRTIAADLRSPALVFPPPYSWAPFFVPLLIVSPLRLRLRNRESRSEFPMRSSSPSLGAILEVGPRTITAPRFWPGGRAARLCTSVAVPERKVRSSSACAKSASAPSRCARKPRTARANSSSRIFIQCASGGLARTQESSPHLPT